MSFLKSFQDFRLSKESQIIWLRVHLRVFWKSFCKSLKKSSMFYQACSGYTTFNFSNPAQTFPARIHSSFPRNFCFCYSLSVSNHQKVINFFFRHLISANCVLGSFALDSCRLLLPFPNQPPIHLTDQWLRHVPKTSANFFDVSCFSINLWLGSPIRQWLFFSLFKLLVRVFGDGIPVRRWGIAFFFSFNRRMDFVLGIITFHLSTPVLTRSEWHT